MHNGKMTMLDTSNAKVLSYLRKGEDGKSVVVALNFTGAPQTVSLSEAGSGKVSTLMTDAAELKGASSLGSLTLPAYGSWVGEVR